MSEPLKLISLNCEGDKHWNRIFPFIEQFKPDVLCLQEVFEQDLDMLKEKFGMDGVYAPTGTILKPNNYGLPPHGRWGVALLTKLPFEDASYAYYKGTGDHIPEVIDGEPNAVNRVLVTLHGEKDGHTYVIATTHFTWSMAGETTPEQLRDFERLSQLLDKVPEVILCGDFNAPRGREVYTALSQRYQDTIPSDVTSSLDPELHKVGHKQLMIDGLFLSPAYKADKVEVVCGVSDHCGIRAVIQRVG
jgi:endonuclease/exonuclease/phosphatase family metal-dependent hydrolase